MEYSCRVCCSTGKLSNRSWSIIVPVSVATMIVPAPLSPVKLEKNRMGRHRCSNFGLNNKQKGGLVASKGSTLGPS